MMILNLLFFKQNVNIAGVPFCVEQVLCILNVRARAKITTVAIKQTKLVGTGGQERNAQGILSNTSSVCQWVPLFEVCICTSVFLFQL